MRLQKRSCPIWKIQHHFHNSGLSDHLFNLRKCYHDSSKRKVCNPPPKFINWNHQDWIHFLSSEEGPYRGFSSWTLSRVDLQGEDYPQAGVATNHGRLYRWRRQLQQRWTSKGTSRQFLGCKGCLLQTPFIHLGRKGCMLERLQQSYIVATTRFQLPKTSKLSFGSKRLQVFDSCPHCNR